MKLLFYEYDNKENPLIEMGYILIRPELTTKNNVILTSLLGGSASNYNYEYNSKGFH